MDDVELADAGDAPGHEEPPPAELANAGPGPAVSDAPVHEDGAAEEAQPSVSQQGEDPARQGEGVDSMLESRDIVDPPQDDSALEGAGQDEGGAEPEPAEGGLEPAAQEAATDGEASPMPPQPLPCPPSEHLEHHASEQLREDASMREERSARSSMHDSRSSNSHSHAGNPLAPPSLHSSSRSPSSPLSPTNRLRRLPSNAATAVQRQDVLALARAALQSREDQAMLTNRIEMRADAARRRRSMVVPDPQVRELPLWPVLACFSLFWPVSACFGLFWPRRSSLASRGPPSQTPSPSRMNTSSAHAEPAYHALLHHHDHALPRPCAPAE